MTIRVRLDLAYDGSDFCGWARQPGLRSVEQTVADALATALRLAEPPALTVAGRTDAGVHATGQVAHVDVDDEQLDCARLARSLRALLPADVVVREVSRAPDGFDARFAATGRRYCYCVTDGTPNPLRRNETLHWSRPLNVDNMNEAAQALVGEHDFAAYCRPRPGATTIRTLRRLDAVRNGEVVAIHAEADAFCHQQVRSMVGALLAVGDGRRPVSWPGEVLTAGVRDGAVTVAPAHGLTLVGVDYPADELLAARVNEARARRDET